MADLIDRQALLQDIEESVVFSVREGVPSAEMRGAHKITDRIKAAPAIDPESLRPQGEWIDIYGGKYANPRYACSACGEKALYKFEADALDHVKAVQALSKSCPNCGAKMKGAGDNG